jgi:hypothetical protein
MGPGAMMSIPRNVPSARGDGQEGVLYEPRNVESQLAGRAIEKREKDNAIHRSTFGVHRLVRENPAVVVSCELIGLGDRGSWERVPLERGN